MRASVDAQVPADDDRSALTSPSADEEPVRVLLVEDDEDDYLITRELLQRAAHLTVAIDWASTYEQGLAAILEQGHDVYLIDYRLGGRSGLELIREAFAARSVAPVIMLTGERREGVDLEATALGATDFLTKSGLRADELERAIRHAISQQRAERHALAARASDDGIWEWDLTTELLYLSPRWNAILGLLEEGREVSPDEWFALVAPEDVLRLRNQIEAHLAGQTPSLECAFRMRHRDGSWRWVEVQGVATRDVDGTPIRMAGALSDTTDRHVEQQRLEREALHDTLTGLPNRTLFIDRVEQTLQRASRESQAGCALLFLDIDEFKQVNDGFSHAAGDRLLVAFAERIAGELRPGDTVARLGGDEFTVLLEELTDPAEATVIAERILEAMHEPFQLEGSDLRIGVSIGISLSAEGLSAADLISAADLAMYDAKRRGRGRWAVFDEQMHRRVTDRLARQTELRHVIEQSLLEVHYQPIVGLDSGRIIGLEALARWPSDRAPLEPADFILMAEQTGMIAPLGEYVLREALRAFAGWVADGLAGEDLWVSVNLSARQLSDPALIEQIRRAVRASGLDGRRLRLEIVESTMMALERSEPFVAGVTADGIGLHVDHFGTGYSSLTALHRLPITALKIDRGLVAGIDQDSNRTIARSVIALAHSLGVAAIGAAIESAPARAVLRELGCDAGQGVALAPVLPGHAIAGLLTRSR